jgi:hypothetical protein
MERKKGHDSSSPESAGSGPEDEEFFARCMELADEAETDATMPSYQKILEIMKVYRNGLSPKKRAKSLLDQSKYDAICEILDSPKDTAKYTAQFRFWCRKMFVWCPAQQPGQGGVLLHEGKPVAVIEQIPDVLIHSHRQANHGGRDKTSAEVSHRGSSPRVAAEHALTSRSESTTRGSPRRLSLALSENVRFAKSERPNRRQISS